MRKCSSFRFSYHKRTVQSSKSEMIYLSQESGANKIELAKNAKGKTRKPGSHSNKEDQSAKRKGEVDRRSERTSPTAFAMGKRIKKKKRTVQ